MLIHMHTAGRENDDVGKVFPLPGKKGEAVMAYNGTGSAVAVGEPVLLIYAATEGREVTAGAAATMAFAVQVAVAMEATPSGDVGPFQISGLCEALVEDTSTRAAGVFLEVINAGTNFIYDAASRSTNSAAVLVDAITAAENGGSPVLKTVLLIPEGHIIAGS